MAKKKEQLKNPAILEVGTIHHQEILDRLDDFKNRFQGIEEKLNPIYEAYIAANRLGAWAKYLLYVVATILGAILAWKELHK